MSALAGAVPLAVGLACPPLAALLARGLDLGSAATVALIAGAGAAGLAVVGLVGKELRSLVARAQDGGPSGGPRALLVLTAGAWGFAAAVPGAVVTFVLTAAGVVCALLLSRTTMVVHGSAGGLVAGIVGGVGVVALAAASENTDAVLAGGLGAAGLLALAGVEAQANRRPALDPDARPLLTCSGVTVHYGSRRALGEIDLEVSAGELLAVVGTNGAGKTTLLRTISGLTAPGAGVVAYAGADLGPVPAERRTTLGITHMAGVEGVFETLTVTESLRLASRGDAAGADRLLARLPALADRRASAVRTLSGGERQLLALAQALVTRPRLLLLDDLSTGLADDALGAACELIRSENAAGTTVVLVEQSLTLALGLAPRVVFLEDGQIRFDGTPAALRERRDLLRAVLVPGSPA